MNFTSMRILFFVMRMIFKYYMHARKIHCYPCSILACVAVVLVILRLCGCDIVAFASNYASSFGVLSYIDNGMIKVATSTYQVSLYPPRIKIMREFVSHTNPRDLHSDYLYSDMDSFD